MAFINFSTLVDGQKLVFHPTTDQLVFDSIYQANELIVYQTTAGLVLGYPSMPATTSGSVHPLQSAKTITLTGMKLEQVAGRNNPVNIHFATGGLLLVGNDSTANIDPINGTDNGINSLIGSDFNDMLLGLGGNDTLSGRIGNDTVDGGDGNDQLYGDEGADKLLGGKGNDRLDGGKGADVMWGGDGNDLYQVDDNGDLVIETNPVTATGGIDTVESTIAKYTLSPNVENLTLVEQHLTSASDVRNDIDAVGNTLNNIILGNTGENTIDGGQGADYLAGGNGNDVYVVDDVTTKFVKDGKTYTGDQVVETSNDNNPDNDTPTNVKLDYIDMVQSSVSYTLPAFVENLQLMGGSDINGTGNEQNNFIFANDGNNILKGGADSVSSGYTDGNPTETALVAGDTVDYANATSGVTVDLTKTTAQDTIGSGVDTISGFENVFGSAYADHLIGNDGPNLINGGSTISKFSGDSGADLLEGGKGNDTYIVDGNDTIVETSTGGIDTVDSWVNYTLPANVENLRLLSFLKIPNPPSDPIDATGNSLANTLIGNAKNNVLNGMAGADKMYGGAGDDTYFVDNVNDLVDENISIPMYDGTNATQLGAGTNDTVRSFISYNIASAKHKQLESGVENLQLMGSGNLDATGNELDNILWANRGNNVLAGGAQKSAGDTVSYEFGAKSGLTVDLHKTTAQATGGSGSDTLNGIENLTGGVFNDFITGDEGKNTLDGGLGIDTVYYNSATVAKGVVVNLGGLGTAGSAAGGGGADILRNFENVVGSRFDDILTGTTGNNVLDGGANEALGDTVSYEAATAPPISGASVGAGVVVNLSLTTVQNTGGSGYDKLLGIENLIGSKLDDVITGTSGDNALSGLAGDDVLVGGAGNDVLTGGLGRDTLTGGAGFDAFVYGIAPAAAGTAVGDSGIGLTKRDVITDFASGVDKIVATFDANPKLTGTQHWTFVTTTITNAGEVRFDAATHLLYFDTDGSPQLPSPNPDPGNVPDFQIELTGVAKVVATDFIFS